jgi:YihY family inner membrane protein
LTEAEIRNNVDSFSFRELALDGIPIKELGNRVWKEIDVDNLPGLAAQASYYFVLALFPFLVLLAALVESLPFTGLWGEVLTWNTHHLPPEAQHLILQAVTNLTRGRQSFLSVGLLGTAWAVCAGLMNLMCSLNTAYEVQETRSFPKRLGLAFVMFLLLTFLFVGSFGFLSAGDWLGTWLVNRAGPSLLVTALCFVGRWVLSLLLLAVGVAILDYALPNLQRQREYFTPGTLFVVLAWAPATLGFHLYVRHFASYNRTYGTLGGFVFLMVGLYIISLLVLVGAEINCELRKMRAETKPVPVQQLPFPRRSPGMRPVLSLPEERIVLHNVSWETYERLLAEHSDITSPRFTFDHGELEIMSPSAEHERLSLRIADLIGVLADQMDLEVEDLGSITFRRQELDRGFEQGSCFYVQNVERVLGKDQIDLVVDPPPDLVLEVDTTCPSISELPMFAEFGVPEVWRFDGSRLSILRLSRDGYQEVDTSDVFPGASAKEISNLIAKGGPLGRTGWLRLARGWARERYGKSSA